MTPHPSPELVQLHLIAGLLIQADITLGIGFVVLCWVVFLTGTRRKS